MKTGIALMCLLISLSSLAHEPASSESDSLEEALQKSRCYVTVNGIVSKPLKRYQSLRVRNPINPILRYSNYAAYLVEHELRVKEGATEGTITLELLKDLPQRGVKAKVIKKYENLKIDKLSVTGRWEVTNKFEVNCI